MRTIILMLAGSLLVGSVGCSQTDFSESIWNPFGLELSFDITKPPVRLGIVHSNEGMLALDKWILVRKAPPYAKFRDRLSRHLGCGVQILELEPFQIAAHLQSGRLNYALVSDADYRSMTEEGPVGELLASAVPLRRRGLIIASAKSDVENLEQIKGRRFAFGPKNDPILAAAAMKALNEGGVSRDDIKKELLMVVPNAERLQYHLSSFEAAKEVAYGIGTEVGVVEESEYKAMADTGGRLLPLKLAKDDFRVLGHTEEIQAETTLAGPFIASAEADPEMTRKVREFLSTIAADDVQALYDVGLARFNMAALTGVSNAAVANSTD